MSLFDKILGGTRRALGTDVFDEPREPVVATIYFDGFVKAWRIAPPGEQYPIASTFKTKEKAQEYAKQHWGEEPVVAAPLEKPRAGMDLGAIGVRLNKDLDEAEKALGNVGWGAVTCRAFWKHMLAARTNLVLLDVETRAHVADAVMQRYNELEERGLAECTMRNKMGAATGPHGEEILGLTGDKDLFTAGGGIVFKRRDDSIGWMFWDEPKNPNPDEDGFPCPDYLPDDCCNLAVHFADVPDDVLKEYDWIDVKKIAQDPADLAALERMSTAKDVMERVAVLEAIVSHYGAHEIDDAPAVHRVGELREEWEPPIKAFQKKGR